ncbi:hypothetical protein HY636_04305 [Candidatus Woesearchaeota archaeon]|nr:hypothetical protein [Candidatus Woesearchaeota archaeon]
MELTSTNMDLCIIRYAEIALKGKNRQLFEKKLVYNLKNCLKLNKLPFAEIKRFEGRIFVFIDKNNDLDLNNPKNHDLNTNTQKKEGLESNPYSLLANVFGVSSISFPVESTLTLEPIQTAIDNLIKERIKDKVNGKNFNTFRITTKKLDQTISKSSHEFDVELGSYVETIYKKKVSLKEFDLNIQVELIHGKAYVFLDKVKGVGGLPYGIEGRTLALVKNKQDLFAALLMMKRGCAVVCLTLPSLESTLRTTFLNYGVKPKIINVNAFDNEKIDEIKFKENIEDITKHHKIKEFDKITITETTKFHKTEEFDKRTIEEIAKFHQIESIVTGQTLNNFKPLTNLVEFRPLIGMDEGEIRCKIKEMI